MEGDKKIAAARRIIAAGGCLRASVYCPNSTEAVKRSLQKRGWITCPFDGTCLHAASSARQYLKEHREEV